METSCGLVLVNYDSLLLLRYPQGHWDFVKGHIERGDESHEETALRELFEETGIDRVELMAGFAMRTEYQFTHKGEVVDKEVHWFLGLTDEISVSLSHEHTGYLWLPWDDALKQLTFENSQNVLRAARAHLQNA